MAKESKEQKSSNTPPPEPTGGMNTGVAVIGFILCFMAGMGIRLTQRQVRTGGIGAEPGAQAAWDDSASPIPVSSKDPTWGNAHARPSRSCSSATSSARSAARSSRRSASSRRSTAREAPRRVEEQPAARSTRTRARRRSPPRRCSASAGNDGLLEVPRDGVPEPAGAHARELRAVGRRRPASTRPSSRPRFDKQAVRRRRSTTTWPSARRSASPGTPGVVHQRRDFLSGAQPIDKFTGRHRRAARQGRRRRSPPAPRPTRSTRSSPARTRRRRRAQPADAEADRSPPRTTRPSGRCPSATRPVEGRRRRARHDRRVLRLPVPVLQPRRADHRRGHEDATATRSASSGSNNPLPFHPRAEPAARARDGGPRAEGRQGLLGRARHALQEPAEARRRGPPRLREGARPRRRQGEGRDQGPQVQGRHRRPTWTSPTTSRPAARRTSSSTAAASWARSRSRSSRRSSTRSSRRPRRSSRKGITAKDVYDEIMKDGKEPPAAREEDGRRRPPPTAPGRAARTRRS